MSDPPEPEVPPEPESVAGPHPDAGATRAEEGFLPRRPPRRGAESAFVRAVATAGVVGVATAVAAIMGSQDVAAWIIGLVVSLISVILAGLLWRSRTL